MTQRNIMLFEHLHEHREYQERVFTSLEKWEPTRTDRGTSAFPTALIADACNPDRTATCEWRIDKIEGTGGVCVGLSDLSNEEIADDWAGAGKKDRVWYAIIRGGRDAVGGLNNGNANVVDSLPAYKSGCVIRLELSDGVLAFTHNGKPAGTLHITQQDGSIGKLRFGLQTWQSRVTLVHTSGLSASTAAINRRRSTIVSTPLKAATSSPSSTTRDRFRFQCDFQCECKKNASWAKPGRSGALAPPSRAAIACCDDCDATLLLMQAQPCLRARPEQHTPAAASTTQRSSAGGSRLSWSTEAGAPQHRIRSRRARGDVEEGPRSMRTAAREKRSAMVSYCGREYVFDRSSLNPRTHQGRGQQLESSLHLHWLNVAPAWIMAQQADKATDKQRPRTRG